MGKSQTQGLRQVTCWGSVHRDISVRSTGSTGQITSFFLYARKAADNTCVDWGGGVTGAPFSHVQQVKLIRPRWGCHVVPRPKTRALCVPHVEHISERLYLRNMCLFSVYTGARVTYKRSKSLIWHLRAVDGPLEMASAAGHFLECFELLQTRCKTCHWSRK